MNAILGMAELSLREVLPDAAMEYVSTLKQAGVNLLDIINDILDFSKIETGQSEGSPEDYMFSSLVNDVINIINPRILDSQLQLVVDIDCNLPSALKGDVVRIRQIMLNLLSNAVKYTDEGHVSFSVTGAPVDEDNTKLIIRVEDSGRGIRREDLETLFDEFTRFDTKMNKDREGTGLGLAITSSLVKAMNGEIHVDSEYGIGSVFTVILPQGIANNKKLAQVNSPESQNVLIFERREACINSITRTLDDLGVKHKLVSSASGLNDELTGNRYSFVFLAATLYDGVKKTHWNAETSAIPVLIAEFGEVVPARNISVLTSPIFSIPLANMLNGVSEKNARTFSIKPSAGFTAPDVKVLVVDDINTNLIVAKGLMQPYNMRIDLCSSGAEAIDAITSGHYDLVFMDHMMPEMDGAEATARIRAMAAEDPRYAEIPIIALTANAVTGAREKLMASGFNDFLSKPIDTAKLNSVIKKWIPKEKRQGAKADAHAPPAGESREITSITGVNTRKGIALTGGAVDNYHKILAIYLDDGLEKLAGIRACLDNGDLALFTTYVHALKSASASIGADGVSADAEALEMAGLREDAGFIQANADKFLSDLEVLLGSIDEALSAVKDKPDQTPVNMDAVKTELKRLKTAFDDYDTPVINEIADSLQSIAQSSGIGGQISKILHHKLTGEYDEAVALIDALL
jgi:CheY-like chemotaxis protein/two-component sensor histidine kinase